MSIPILRAARIVGEGGVIAYPTEGVYGLGCLPDDEEAIVRLLTIKKRDPGLGLVLVAADAEQLEHWIRLPAGARIPESSLEHPQTWVVPAASSVPLLVRGDHTTVAARITVHPVAARLCRAARSALVSTSANISGRRPARNVHVLRRTLGHLVDCIVPGPCGPASGPSEIRDLLSGAILRPAS